MAQQRLFQFGGIVYDNPSFIREEWKMMIVRWTNRGDHRVFRYVFCVSVKNAIAEWTLTFFCASREFENWKVIFQGQVGGERHPATVDGSCEVEEHF